MLCEQDHIPLRFRNGNTKYSKKRGGHTPQRLLPFPFSCFSALLAPALTIASARPGLSPRASVLGLSTPHHQFIPCLDDGAPPRHASSPRRFGTALAAPSVIVHSHFLNRNVANDNAITGRGGLRNREGHCLSSQRVFSRRWEEKVHQGRKSAECKWVYGCSAMAFPVCKLFSACAEKI